MAGNGVQPTRLVSEVLPGQGYQTEQSLVNIANALNRLAAIAAPTTRTLDLSASQTASMATTDNNGTVIFSATGASATFTFQPTRTMLTSIVRLVNNGANAVTLLPSSADDTIDVTTLPAGAAYSYQSNGAGKWNRIAAGTNATVIPLSNATPLVESGAGDPGVSTDVSRADHVHPAYAPPATTKVYANTSIPAGNTVANTAAETAFASGYTFLANTLAVEDVIRVSAFGVYSTDNTVQIKSVQFRLYLGTTLMLDSGAITLVTNISNLPFAFEFLMTINSIGATGSVEAQAHFFRLQGALSVLPDNTFVNTAPVTLDTTVNEALTLSVQWGFSIGASAADTVTLRQMVVELL